MLKKSDLPKSIKFNKIIHTETVVWLCDDQQHNYLIAEHSKTNKPKRPYKQTLTKNKRKFRVNQEAIRELAKLISFFMKQVPELREQHSEGGNDVFEKFQKLLNEKWWNDFYDYLKIAAAGTVLGTVGPLVVAPLVMAFAGWLAPSWLVNNAAEGVRFGWEIGKAGLESGMPSLLGFVIPSTFTFGKMFLKCLCANRCCCNAKKESKSLQDFLDRANDYIDRIKDAREGKEHAFIDDQGVITHKTEKMEDLVPQLYAVASAVILEKFTKRKELRTTIDRDKGALERYENAHPRQNEDPEMELGADMRAVLLNT